MKARHLVESRRRPRRLSGLQFFRESIPISTSNNPIFFQKAIYASDCDFSPEPVCRQLQSHDKTYRSSARQNRREWQNGIRVHAGFDRQSESRCTIHAVCANDIPFADAECKAKHWVHLPGSRRSQNHLGKCHCLAPAGEITTAESSYDISQIESSSLGHTNNSRLLLTQRPSFHT